MQPVKNITTPNVSKTKLIFFILKPFTFLINFFETLFQQLGI